MHITVQITICVTYQMYKIYQIYLTFARGVHVLENFRKKFRKQHQKKKTNCVTLLYCSVS